MKKMRVRVLRADGVYMGTMDARIGMVDTNGREVHKVNPKTVKTTSGLHDTFSLYWFEAERFGFPHSADSKQVEDIRPSLSKEDAFDNGMQLFKDGQPPPKACVLMKMGWQAAGLIGEMEERITANYLRTAIEVHDQQQKVKETEEKL